jgi:prepilin-type processing-associated H-X9-DG protein
VKKNCGLKIFLFSICIAAVLLFINIRSAYCVVVNPLQTGHYIPCVINVRDFINPPPGLYLFWYNYYITSDKYIDRNGNEFESINFSQINPALPDAEVDLQIQGFAIIPALAWASSFTILGGARYIVAISPNVLFADGSVTTEVGGGVIDKTITNTNETNVSGFSDMLIIPVGISWGFEHFDTTFAYGIYAPTGRYERGGTDNTGLGFWTHQFQGFGYYYPFTNKSTALMAALTYEINSEIEDTEVKPGNRLTLEWGLSQYFSERLDLGIQGGHNWQVSPDTGREVIWDSSQYDRKSITTFAIGYWPWKQRLYATFKYGFEYGIRQRFKNNNWYLNITFITNALTGSK